MLLDLVLGLLTAFVDPKIFDKELLAYANWVLLLLVGILMV